MEGDLVMKGSSILIKETPESSLTHSVLCRLGQKRDIHEPGSEVSADTSFAGALISDFSASRMVRNKCLLFFVSHPIYSILLEQPE